MCFQQYRFNDTKFESLCILLSTKRNRFVTLVIVINNPKVFTSFTKKSFL
jgi:hypothetical protein